MKKLNHSIEKTLINKKIKNKNCFKSYNDNKILLYKKNNLINNYEKLETIF